ncbi:MAG TPA: hypothetical protein VF955_02800, partial [Pyrinomonadaceae bacterium]
MATGLVIHLSSGKDKHTHVLTDERIRIGNCEDCAVRLRSPSLPTDGSNNNVVLELARTNGAYRVVGFDRAMSLTHNGKAVKIDKEIEDGDEVR